MQLFPNVYICEVAVELIDWTCPSSCLDHTNLVLVQIGLHTQLILVQYAQLYNPDAISYIYMYIATCSVNRFLALGKDNIICIRVIPNTQTL